ncbi:hypothetical protein pb186bvf_011088 [Paramecium bursaria]
MKTSPAFQFKSDIEETVWHTRKQRQETEKEVQLLKNRLKLLKKEDQEIQNKIDETKKKTQSMIDLKINHLNTLEQKKRNQLDDEENMKSKQRQNYELMKETAEQQKMIQEAMRQIKREEFIKIKQVSLKHQEEIQKQKEEFLNRNKEKREIIQQVMGKSKSNISIFWNEKLEKISKENEKAKIGNLQAKERYKQLQDKLQLEESYMIQKLQKSSEIQKKLAIELEKTKNLHPEEFKKKLSEEDRDKTVTLRKNKSNQSYDLQPKWLPIPDKDSTLILGTETENRNKGTNRSEHKNSGED